MDVEDFYGLNYGIKEFKYKEFTIKNKKVTINDKYFGKKNGFLIFYSIYCRHCKESVEFWSNIAINNLNSFPIGAVNCQDLKNKNDYLIPLLKISHYPTIKFIENGEIKDLDIGNIDISNIYFFIDNNTSSN